MDKFVLRPYTKPDLEESESWKREEYASVTVTIPMTRFVRLKIKGKEVGLSMRQVVSQMVLFAEERM